MTIFMPSSHTQNKRIIYPLILVESTREATCTGACTGTTGPNEESAYILLIM